MPGVIVLAAVVSGLTMLVEVACVRGLSFVVERGSGTLLLFLALMGGGMAALTASLAGHVLGDRGWRVRVWVAAVSLAPMVTLAIAARSFWASLIVAVLPFAFGGLLLMHLYASWPVGVGPLYLADLLGAAAGALVGSVLVGSVGVPGTLAMAAGGAWLLAAGVGRRGRWLLGALGLLCIALPAVPRVREVADRGMVGFMDPAKSLSSSLARGWVRITETRWTSLGRLDRVDPIERRGMAVIYVDGENPVAAVTDRLRAAVRQRAVYQVPAFIGGRGEEIVVIGAGAGADVLAAEEMGAKHALGVEINPGAALMGREGPGGGGDLVFMEGRAYLQRSTGTFHRIVYPLTFNTSAPGRSFGASHVYLYTRQGMEAALRRLRDDGLVVIVDDQVTRLPWIVSSVKAALGRAASSAGPEAHLLILSTQRYGPPMWYVFAGRSPWALGQARPYLVEAERLGLHPEWVSPRGPSTKFGRLLAHVPASFVLTDERPLPQMRTHWGVVGLLLGILALFAWWGITPGRRAPGRLPVCVGFTGLGLVTGMTQGVLLDRFGLLTGATGQEMILALPALLIGSAMGGWMGGRVRGWGWPWWLGVAALGSAIIGNAWLVGAAHQMAPAVGIGGILLAFAGVGAALAMPFTRAYRTFGAGSTDAGLGWGWDSWGGALGLLAGQVAMRWVGVSATLMGGLIGYSLCVGLLARYRPESVIESAR